MFSLTRILDKEPNANSHIIHCPSPQDHSYHIVPPTEKTRDRPPGPSIDPRAGSCHTLSPSILLRPETSQGQDGLERSSEGHFYPYKLCLRELPSFISCFPTTRLITIQGHDASPTGPFANCFSECRRQIKNVTLESSIVSSFNVDSSSINPMGRSLINCLKYFTNLNYLF